MLRRPVLTTAGSETAVYSPIAKQVTNFQVVNKKMIPLEVHSLHSLLPYKPSCHLF